MEKSNITDKSTIEQAINQALGQVVKQVKHWTRKELVNILDQQRKQDQPLIVPLGSNCYLIGNYAIRPYQDHWLMIYRYNDQELVFANKTAAIFYAVCQQRGRTQLADQIYTYDNACVRLSRDHTRFRQRLEHSQQRGHGSQDLYRSRYLETQAQLRHQQQLLEKSLKMAKYIKL